MHDWPCFFSITAFSIESAHTGDRLVMACAYAKSLHWTWWISCFIGSGHVPPWQLAFAHFLRAAAQAEQYTWNARSSYKMQERQQDEILSLVVGTQTGNKGCCQVFQGSLVAAASSNQISTKEEKPSLSTSHQWHSCQLARKEFCMLKLWPGSVPASQPRSKNMKLAMMAGPGSGPESIDKWKAGQHFFVS